MTRVRLSLVGLGVALGVFVAALAYNAVDNSLTDEDRRYIPKYLIGIVVPKPDRTYEQELDFIVRVQRSVLDIAPHERKLPLDQKREPKQLYESKVGYCYDRSRVIEKILRYANFETRHVSLYSTKSTRSALASLLTPGISSHAITEVRTSRGWLVVDSNDPWVAETSDGLPVSVRDIEREAEGMASIQWKTLPPNQIYRQPFVFVYGLYSRHGRFYPPYNSFPDIHYGEFAANFGL